MKLIGNAIWFVFVGFLSFIVWIFLGIALYVTIIGIPLSRQCFKIANLTIWPFGKEVNSNLSRNPIANIIWIILLGWELMVSYFVIGIIFCITIVGIPFGHQCFKLAVLSLAPFGANIR